MRATPLRSHARPGRGVRVAPGPAPKGYRDGTHREIAPQESLARLQPAIRAAGITRVANVTGLDRLNIPVVTVCRPRTRSLSVYQGKGVTLAAAKVSGIMESIERHAGEYLRPPDAISTYDRLRRRVRVVSPKRLPQPCGGGFARDREIGWIEGFDLLAREPAWLPYEVVHLDTRLPGRPDRGCFANASTGIAAGNSRTEALVHGLCEVIERDAVTLWRLRPPALQALVRVDPATVDDRVAGELLARVRSAGLAVALWDATSDVGIPCFVCRLVERRTGDFQPSDAVDGAGSHPSRGVALARAITEAAQGRLTLIAGSRDDVFRHHYRLDRPRELSALTRQILEDKPRRVFTAAPTYETEDLRDDLALILGRLERTGVTEAVVVDITHPGVGVPVVRVTVPMLEDGVQMVNFVPRQRALHAFWGGVRSVRT